MKTLCLIFLALFSFLDSCQSDQEKIQGYWRIYQADSTYATIEFRDTMAFINEHFSFSNSDFYSGFQAPAIQGVFSFYLEDGYIRQRTKNDSVAAIWDGIPYHFDENKQLILTDESRIFGIGKKYDKNKIDLKEDHFADKKVKIELPELTEQDSNLLVFDKNIKAQYYDFYIGKVRKNQTRQENTWAIEVYNGFIEAREIPLYIMESCGLSNLNQEKNLLFIIDKNTPLYLLDSIRKKQHFRLLKFNILQKIQMLNIKFLVMGLWKFIKMNIK